MADDDDDVERARPPITLAEFNQLMLPAARLMMEREIKRMMEPNPLLDLLQQNMPPPKPLPWWRRWWWGVTRRLGTSLIAWGRKLGGDED